MGQVRRILNGLWGKFSPPRPVGVGELAPDDVVIAVMGATGAGKTTFINIATGANEHVGGTLARGSTEIRYIAMTSEEHKFKIVLVDTPGFDDQADSDFKLLVRLGDWLKRSYKKDVKLSGVLYFQKISDTRMGGISSLNLTMLQDLCGDRALRNVIFVTTMWDLVETDEVGNTRETEMINDFWGPIVADPQTCRFDRKKETARDIIDRASNTKKVALQVQEELVDRDLQLGETKAAKNLLGRVV